MHAVFRGLITGSDPEDMSFKENVVKRRLSLGISLTILVTVVTLLSGISQADTIIGIAGKCLHVKGGNTTDGAQVVIWPCNNQNAQEWTFTGNGEIRGIGNKCLDVKGGGSADGTLVELWSCNGGANQKWKLSNSLILGIGNKCLTVEGGSPDNGTPLIIWPCRGGAPQEWKVDRHSQF
jgi:Ricin-type beta-trefoil lectin domain